MRLFSILLVAFAGCGVEDEPEAVCEDTEVDACGAVQACCDDPEAEGPTYCWYEGVRDYTFVCDEEDCEAAEEQMIGWCLAHPEG